MATKRTRVAGVWGISPGDFGRETPTAGMHAGGRSYKRRGRSNGRRTGAVARSLYTPHRSRHGANGNCVSDVACKLQEIELAPGVPSSRESDTAPPRKRNNLCRPDEGVLDGASGMSQIQKRKVKGGMDTDGHDRHSASCTGGENSASAPSGSGGHKRGRREARTEQGHGCHFQGTDRGTR